MNERVRHLYDKALVATGKENQFETTRLDVTEKFAELVVLSCIDEVISQMWHCGIDESNNPQFYKVIDKVKENFGVKL
jgi:hypothetical protein